MKRVLITLVIVLLTNLSFSNALETSKTINVNVTVKDFLRIFNMNNEDDNISLTVDNENIEKKLEGRKDFCVRSTKKSYKLNKHSPKTVPRCAAVKLLIKRLRIFKLTI